MEHLLLYQDDAKKINQFFIKLLKPLPGWRLVNHENWVESLAKEYKKRELEVDFPVPSTASTILTIPLLQRLEILRNLCEFHLEQPEHFWELLRVKDGESDWRIEPIGKDSQNRRYWLFSDARLYREIEGKAPSRTSKKSVLSWDIENEGNWELICLTRADYEELLNSLTAEKGKEKSFLKLIRDEIIPKVEPILNYQLAQHRKYFKPVASERISLLPRKRSTRLLAKEIEDEQRRLEQEAAEKERQAILKEQQQFFDFAPVTKSAEQVEKDLAAEREMRAEMRRLKKEKELQIKEIEEAFYSSLNNETESGENVEIISEDEDAKLAEEPAPLVIPKSPIKIVFKVTKPSEPTVKEEEIVDIVDNQNEVSMSNTEEDIEEEIETQDLAEIKDENIPNATQETLLETITTETPEGLMENISYDSREALIENITDETHDALMETITCETPEDNITSETQEETIAYEKPAPEATVSNETHKLDGVNYNVSEEDANLLNSLSNNL